MKKGLLLIASALFLFAGTSSAQFTENFETQPTVSTGTHPNVTISGWINQAEAGTRVWQARQYGTATINRYAQLSAFSSSSPEESNIAWLITPAINLTGATKALTFDAVYGYYTHNALSVHYSTNFDGSNISAATWTNLTFTHPDWATQVNNYTPWTSSGSIDLSAISGNVYIAFKYTGSGTNSQTTTSQVDNISVTGVSSVGDVATLRYSVFPNPTTDVLNIEAANQIKNVVVSDLSGRQVMTSNQSKLDVSELSYGVYMIQVTDNTGKTGVAKFVKK